MGGITLIGIAVVALAALALQLMPPSRVGRFAHLARFAAAALFIAVGVYLVTRGAMLPSLFLFGAAGLILARRFLAARRGATGSGPSARMRASSMTADEAYEVLGLRPGASPDDVRRAHRELMLKLHPDAGGNDYLASKLNQARDILLG